jgi:hypothetical protein
MGNKISKIEENFIEIEDKDFNFFIFFVYSFYFSETLN